MPFNVNEHANLGYIDREVKDMVDEMKQHHGKLLKAELEDIIKEAYRRFQKSVNK
jgi:Holliday junction resolvasome RuvABC DNA-binding subunit